MLAWLREIRKWIIGVVIVVVILLFIRQCSRSRIEPVSDEGKKIVEEAEKEGFKVDKDVEAVPEKEIEEKTGITGKAIKTVSTLEFAEPVKEVEIVVDTLGQVFARGKGEEDTTWVPVEVTTIKRKDRGGFIKKDLGIRLGIGWDLSKKVQYGGTIQFFSLFDGTVSAPDLIATNEYSGVGIGISTKALWKKSPLKNTMIGIGGVWDYSKLGGYPKMVITATVRL